VTKDVSRSVSAGAYGVIERSDQDTISADRNHLAEPIAVAQINRAEPLLLHPLPALSPKYISCARSRLFKHDFALRRADHEHVALDSDR